MYHEPRASDIRAIYERHEKHTSIPIGIRATYEELASDMRANFARATRQEFHECMKQFHVLVNIMASVGECLRVRASVHE